jgi:hypothetical protein
MPEVIWQAGPNSAIDDVKELPREIRHDLFALSRIVLIDAPIPELNADEGVIEDEWMFRRAATRESMAALASRPDGHSTTPRTVDYYFIYRCFSPRECATYGNGFFVGRVIDNLHLAWILQVIEQSKG